MFNVQALWSPLLFSSRFKEHYIKNGLVLVLFFSCLVASWQLSCCSDSALGRWIWSICKFLGRFWTLNLFPCNYSNRFLSQAICGSPEVKLASPDFCWIMLSRMQNGCYVFPFVFISWVSKDNLHDLQMYLLVACWGPVLPFIHRRSWTVAPLYLFSLNSWHLRLQTERWADSFS